MKTDFFMLEGGVHLKVTVSETFASFNACYLALKYQFSGVLVVLA